MVSFLELVSDHKRFLGDAFPDHAADTGHLVILYDIPPKVFTEHLVPLDTFLLYFLFLFSLEDPMKARNGSCLPLNFRDRE